MTLPQIKLQLLLFTFFQIQYSLLILSVNATQFVLQTGMKDMTQCMKYSKQKYAKIFGLRSSQ